MTDKDDLPHILPVGEPEALAADVIKRLKVTDPYQVKFIRIHEHMHVVFNFNRPAEERIASLQAIRDILEEG